MKDVYRDVADWRHLVPHERDVLTGERTGLRDDKRRDHDQQDSQGDPHADTSSPPGRWLKSWSTPAKYATGAAVIAVVTVGGVAGVMALTGQPTPQTATGPGPSQSTAATVTQIPPTASPTLAAATAILLSYSGGKLTADECTDASGFGNCVRLDTAFDPLSVRCTPSDCIVTYFGGTGSVAGPLTVTGHTDSASEGCQETTWKLTLTPVGDIVTEGIHHPAKLVGTAQTNRPAEVVSGNNCLGATETYNYDATPS